MEDYSDCIDEEEFAPQKIWKALLYLLLIMYGWVFFVMGAIGWYEAVKMLITSK